MQQPLPIEEIIGEVKSKLSEGNTLILQAPPGAGKSTWLPAQLLQEPWLAGKKILMLEPRRLAAKTVAARLASQLNEEVGETVGYRIRFENVTSAATRLEILTEGILTRMLQQDGALEDTGLVIFDEFHERSLHADLALALCRDVQQIIRPDLRLLIMSATLDGEKLSTLLGHAPIVTSQGRQFPITYHYAGSDDRATLQQQMTRVIRQAMREHEGDVLAFLPGAGEIQRTAELLEAENINARICPLYGDLPIRQQQEVLQPDAYGVRKIVLATSIAETSLTIEGIQIVVDSGYARVPRFDPASGLTKLETVRVTRDAAEQRAGRAGRLGPGVCYRLWTEGFQHHLIPHRSPEILEADLAPLLLDLAQWGTHDIYTLAWLTPPPAGAVTQAKELLRQLGAIEGEKITQRGKEMLRLPTHPRLAHLLTEAKHAGQSALAADIAALLEERDPLLREAGSDLTLRIEALRKWRKREHVNADRKRLERIERIALAWRKLLGAPADNNPPGYGETGKLLAAAYPERIARTENGKRFRLANGKVARMQENDPLASEAWIAIAHLDGGSGGEGRIFLSAPLDPADILHLAQEKKTLEWDAQKGELIARLEKRIGDIIFSVTPLRSVTEEERVAILLEAVAADPSLLDWDEEALALQARLLSLRKWRPEENWPDLSLAHLVRTLGDWLAPYLSPIKRKDDFRKLGLATILRSSLPWDLQQRLDKLAPEKLPVPSGSHIRIQYHADGSPPVLAVRLQELFGMLETPAINEGRTKVMVHLLSPAYRPVQVTQDLANFWKNTYAEVRKELRTRYPKHSWPEDPYSAEAVRGVKRRKD